eukprot:COSAG01_NODE_394_length_17660_cov_5.141954_12_plen_104_part_00
MQRFESEMTELLVEQWRGCSWEVVDLGTRGFQVVCRFCSLTVEWMQIRRLQRVCHQKVSQCMMIWSPSPSAGRGIDGQRCQAGATIGDKSTRFYMALYLLRLD